MHLPPGAPKNFNQYQRQLILRTHYGDGLGTCPLATKLLPELIGGMLNDIIEEIWIMFETALREVLFEGLPCPPPREWERLCPASARPKSTSSHSCV